MYLPLPLEGLLVDVETAPPALYLDLIGEVDIATRHHLNLLSCLPLTNVTMILLDLSQVDFCDTSGIRALIHLRHEQLLAGRQVWITRLTPGCGTSWKSWASPRTSSSSHQTQPSPTRYRCRDQRASHEVVLILRKRRPFPVCRGQACVMEHRYALTVTWTGNTGQGTSAYRGYRRTHTVTAEGPPELLGSADRTFHGDRERWNPEQLFLASLAQCHMLSYLHVCVDAGVTVTHYVDRATGILRTEANGSGQFTEVVLHPEVTVADHTMVKAATEAHHRANELCFIANSVNFPVRHEPIIRTAD